MRVPLRGIGRLPVLLAALLALLLAAFLAVFLAAGVPRSLAAQDPGQEEVRDAGRLAGEVRDGSTCAPIAGVRIGLEPADRQTVTDSAGRFVLTDLAPGDYGLALRHIGYGVRTVPVTVRPRGTTVLDLLLEASPVELEALEVTVEGRFRPRHLERGGFYEREAAGWGSFWDPATLERASTGITRFRHREFFRFFGDWDPWRSAGRGGCDGPAVFVDGRRDRTGLLEDGNLSLSEVGPIEVYRNTHGVPVWALDPEAACGVVIVWLKRW